MSFDTERSAIETHFATEWLALYPSWDFTKNGQVGFDSQEFTPKPEGESVLLTILSGDASQESFGSPGSNLVRHVGLIAVQIFTPSGQGSDAIREIADNVRSVFQNKTLGNVKTKISSVQSRQQDHPFLVWTVATPFRRDEFDG